MQRSTKSRFAITLATRTGASSRRRGDASDRQARKQSKLVWALFAVVFLSGSGAALFAKGGLVDRKRLEREYARENAQLDSLLSDIHQLNTEVSLLKSDPSARERLAREELGYSKRGEMVFLLAEPPEKEPSETP